MSAPMVHAPHCTKPHVVAFCKCGANVACTSCRWGSGQFPCKCSTKSKQKTVAP